MIKLIPLGYDHASEPRSRAFEEGFVDGCHVLHRDEKQQHAVSKQSLFSMKIARLSIALLSLFSFDNTLLGQTVDEENFRTVMIRGQAALDESYKTAALASRVAKDAADTAKAACQTRDDASETIATKLNAESARLTQEARDFAHKSLLDFMSAQRLMPGRSEPIFGQGLALLQLKEYCSAIKKIESVRDVNYRTPETAFALGNALVNSSGVGSREFQNGIALLEEYITDANRSSNPEAFPNLAIAESLKTEAEGKHDALLANSEAKDREPNRARCPMPVPGKTELPFLISILSAIGYNDNIIALGRGLPLPTDTNQKASFYNESSFAIGRDFSLSHPSSLSSSGQLSDKLSLKYIFLADTFAEFPERDRMLHTFLGSYQRSITPKVASLFKLSDQLLFIDQSRSSNIFSAQEALVFSPNAQWKCLLSYYLIRVDGFGPTTPADDPDGFTHRIELAQTVTAVRDRDDLSAVLTITGQYGHEWNKPSGIAGRFERDDLLGKLEWKIFHARNACSFIRGVTMVVSDRWQPDRYSHATFPSSTGTNLFARSEDTNVAAFAVSVAMWYDRYMENAGVPDANRLEVNFDYRHTTRNSNVRSKTYDQNLFLLSLKLNL